MVVGVIRGAVAPVGEVPIEEEAVTGDRTTTAEAVITEGITLEIGTAAAVEEAMEIHVRPGMTAIGIPGRITAREVAVEVTSEMIRTRIQETVVLRTARGPVRNIHRRAEVAEIMVEAVEPEIITVGMVVVLAEALPVVTMMVVAHPTINVAMIIIHRRLVAVVEAAAVELAVIEWIIAVAAGDAEIDPGNRWDHQGRLLPVTTQIGDHRSALRWVRVGRHRCRRCAGVRHEVGLRVVSGTMGAAG